VNLVGGELKMSRNLSPDSMRQASSGRSGPCGLVRIIGKRLYGVVAMMAWVLASVLNIFL